MATVKTLDNGKILLELTREQYDNIYFACQSLEQKRAFGREAAQKRKAKQAEKHGLPEPTTRPYHRTSIMDIFAN